MTPALERATADVLASLANAGAQRLGGVEVAALGEPEVERATRGGTVGASRAPETRATNALGEPVYGPAQAGEVQGFVVPGFNKDHQRLLFLRFGERRRAQAFLRWIAPRIATMEEVLDFRRDFRAARLRLGVADPGLRADGTRDPALTAGGGYFLAPPVSAIGGVLAGRPPAPRPLT